MASKIFDHPINGFWNISQRNAFSRKNLVCNCFHNVKFLVYELLKTRKAFTGKLNLQSGIVFGIHTGSHLHERFEKILTALKHKYLH